MINQATRVAFKCSMPILFCAIFLSAKAQTSKRRSVVFLNNGDSAFGWIRYNGWSRNPETIEFYRDSAQKKGETYSASDLQSFQIFGYRAYQRAVLPHLVEGVLPAAAAGDLVTDGNSAGAMDTVFLQVLVKGTAASLYSYKGSAWIFYLQDSAGHYIGLQEGDDGGKEGFKRQLRKAATQVGRIELFEKIETAEYTRESLSGIVEALNGQQKNVAYSSERTTRHYLRAFAGPGIGLTKLSVSGTEDFLQYIHFSNRITPSFSAGVDFTGSGDFEKSVLRLAVTYSSDYYNGSGPATTSTADQVSYIIKQTNIEPELGFLYHFSQTTRWRLYAGASVGYAFAFYRENQMNQTLPEGTDKNYLKMESGWINAHLCVGVRVNRQFECSLSGLILGDFSEANSFNLTPRTYTFSVLYHFVKSPKGK
ncbi:MAG: hypothetical protein P4L51_06225 [Puia sp.]|nr:hypothetical protein [Puia sp.]